MGFKKRLKKFGKGLGKVGKAGKKYAKPAARIALEIAPVPGGTWTVRIAKTIVDKVR